MIRPVLNLTVSSFEWWQAKAGHGLAIIRAFELGWFALVMSLFLFYADAEGGPLLGLARHVWGNKQEPGDLFGPTFGALALIVGFASGPYVNAAVRMRDDARRFAGHAHGVAAHLTLRTLGPQNYEEHQLVDKLREVIYVSHDFNDEFLELRQRVQNDAVVIRYAFRLERYWSKRAGYDTLVDDGRSFATRCLAVRRRLRNIGLLAALILLILAGCVAYAIVWQWNWWLILGGGLAVLALWWAIKPNILPFRYL